MLPQSEIETPQLAKELVYASGITDKWRLANALELAGIPRIP
jgi:hypothetical protein